MTYTTRKTCRICYSENLEALFDLGDLFLSNFVEPGQERSGPKAPLDLVQCKNCTLVQLRHTVPPEILYKDKYWYRSGVTETMRRALKDVTNWVETNCNLTHGDVVVDIGSNDGTLLREYQTLNILKVGVEPASNLWEEGERGIDCLIKGLWSADLYDKSMTQRKYEDYNFKAKVITALGMFYDLEEPNQFVADVKKVLAPDGWFIVQLMCLGNMLKSCDLGNIAHEHLEYYTLFSLVRLFNAHGLRIIGLDENEVNGGSYRIYVRHEGEEIPLGMGDALTRFGNALGEEAREGYYNTETFDRFYFRMQSNRHDVVRFIREAKADGKKVYAYGASTKGNTILQFMLLDRTLISGAAERSPEKWGKVTVGTGIPIVSEEEARKEADYFLVLPYSFIDEFVERERDWLNGGGKFILPLPKFRLVGREALK
jgi:NDP-4-keto-2,6-dideoxyhexose 3-C-methyltransferase